MFVLDVRGHKPPEGDGSMSMMYTPSLAPGARTLPIGLRDFRGDSDGFYRLQGNMAPLTERPDPRIALSGLGITCDENGVCTLDAGDYDNGGGYVDPSTVLPQLSQIPTESPYPVIITSANPDGSTSTQSMTAAQLAALINSSSASLSKVLAITQGGSVLANGSIIGSSAAAQLAAAQSTLGISAAGLTGLFSNPIVLIGGLAVLVLMMSRK